MLNFEKVNSKQTRMKENTLLCKCVNQTVIKRNEAILKLRSCGAFIKCQPGTV